MTIFSQLPRIWVIPLGIILLAVIGGLDYITGAELSFSIFYLAPVTLVTWLIGRGTGVTFSILAAIIWFVADLAAGHLYTRPFFPYWNAGVRLSFFLVVTLILAELRVRLIRENESARTDFLTGSHNLRSFTERLDAEIDRSRRHGYPFTVAYLDIDDFKTINDRQGHSAGDLLLVKVAEELQRSVRGSDVTARLGGDEFGLLLIETDTAQAPETISRIRKHLLAALQENRWEVTFSLGVITYLSPPDSAEEAIQQADQLMYAVKKGRKNDVQFATWGESIAEDL